ncbi:Transposase IS200 like protein [Planctomycetes bacterium Pan216]|uniref:Transposase IS200 like protein n=1 Tax=Kolteria novifilia TaxID=2527975 RepID=A0A518B7C6_9BACT|nr:Transposase IS200 like protein [Planctomycetes bacterium Pan216]
MAGSFTKLVYHVVFSTKDRYPWMDASIRDELFAFTAGVIRNLEGSQLQIGGMPDHLHLLVRLPASLPISHLLQTVKSNSTRWLNERGQSRGRLSWQRGYGAFTVSESQVDVVDAYIRNQAEHHRTRSFEEEFRELLRKHHIEFDERFMLG